MNKIAEIWPVVWRNATPGQVIRNWTVLKGYLGDTFKIVNLGDHSLEIDTPNARTIIHVRDEDFEGIWELWADYKSGRVQRQEFTPITRVSKYVISILHWLETENKI